MAFAKRGQATIEFLVLIAFFLVFVTPLIAVMLDLSGQNADSVALEQAQQAARSMADAADQVYIQGGSAEITKQVFFPSKMVNVTVGKVPSGTTVRPGRELVLTVQTKSGDSDIVFMTLGQVSDPLQSDKQLRSRLGSGLRTVHIWNDAANGVVVIEYV